MHSINSSTYSTQVFQNLIAVPVLFVKTLFEPLFPAPESCQKAFERTVRVMKKEGVTGIIRRIYRTMKQHPSDTFTVASVALLHMDISQQFKLLPITILATVNITNRHRLIQSITSKIDNKTVLKIVRAVFFTGSFFMIASGPVMAAAYEWNSLADAKAHWSGGACDSSIAQQIRPASECLQSGKEFEECIELVPNLFAKDLYVFTQHPSGAVSIVQKGEKTCFITALELDGEVTKTCFYDVKQPHIRIVEKISTMDLARVHEGLEVGHSVRHIAYAPNAFFGCATFHKQPAQFNLGDKPTCFVTALHHGETGTQTCFDPQNPTAVTVKPIDMEGLDLSFEIGTPGSLVIRDPKRFGLDPGPIDSKIEDPCKCECKCIESESKV